MSTAECDDQYNEVNQPSDPPTHNKRVSVRVLCVYNSRVFSLLKHRKKNAVLHPEPAVHRAVHAAESAGYAGDLVGVIGVDTGNGHWDAREGVVGTDAGRLVGH